VNVNSNAGQLPAEYWTADALGRHGEAERLYVKVLEGMRRVLGDEHPETSRTLSALASMYMKQRRYKESESAALAALRVPSSGWATTTRPRYEWLSRSRNFTPRWVDWPKPSSGARSYRGIHDQLVSCRLGRIRTPTRLRLAVTRCARASQLP
jgi:hypothetical protein